ncbi:hypothetical protein CC80DRAFT_121263 [Byssothecium circinans]|uniref:Uncharacterized protein n=1 Tax=Byssothecium circinans TaxID=147558 RepID=A0A6A5TPL4_9PLEO|nr:hypothetical protein CC80DRAFT_121263 [Byssothecium circinans]
MCHYNWSLIKWGRAPVSTRHGTRIDPQRLRQERESNRQYERRDLLTWLWRWSSLSCGGHKWFIYRYHHQRARKARSARREGSKHDYCDRHHIPKLCRGSRERERLEMHRCKRCVRVHYRGLGYHSGESGEQKESIGGRLLGNTDAHRTSSVK